MCKNEYADYVGYGGVQGYLNTQIKKVGVFYLSPVADETRNKGVAVDSAVGKNFQCPSKIIIRSCYFCVSDKCLHKVQCEDH